MTDQLVALLVAFLALGLTLGIQRTAPGRPNIVLFHNGAWIVALLLFSTGWIAFIPVPDSAWFLIAGSIVAFNVGAFLPIARHRTDPRSGVPTGRSIAGATVVLPCLFALGVLLYLRAVDSQFGVDALFSSAEKVRSLQGGDEFIASFPLYARLLYALGPLVLVLYANPSLSGVRASRAVRIAVIVATVLGLTLSLSRTLLFVGLAWQAAIVLLRPRPNRSLRQKWNRRLGIALVVVVALGSFQVLADLTGRTGSADPRIQAYTRGPLADSASTSVVAYSAGGIAAFGALQAERPAEGWSDGAFTVAPFLKAVPVEAAPSEVSPFTDIPFPFNAYTWLEPYYRDFGPVGVLVLPFLMGLLVALVSVRATASTRHYLIAALLLGLTIWAPFVNKYVSAFTWEYVVILVVVRPVRPRAPRWSDRVTEPRRPALRVGA